MATEKNNKTELVRARVTEADAQIIKERAEKKVRGGSVSEYIRIMAVYVEPMLNDLSELRHAAGRLRDLHDVDLQEVYDFMQSTEKYMGAVGIIAMAEVRGYNFADVKDRAEAFASEYVSYAVTADLFGLAKAYADAQNESK